MKKAVKTVVKVAAKAAWEYVKSPQARRWEIALLSGIGIAVEQAIRQAF